MKKLLCILFIPTILMTSCSSEEKEGKDKKEGEKKEVKEEKEEVEAEAEASYKVKEEMIEGKTFLYMRDTLKMEGIQASLTTAFGAVYGHVTEAGLTPGHPTAAYRDFDHEDFNKEFVMDAGMFVPDTLSAAEGLVVKPFFTGKVLTTTFIGPYDQMGPAYEAIHKYAAENGLELDMSYFWEMYTNDSEKVGMENAETEIYVPVK
jgi:effector-binding domain-containing protein